MPERRAGRFAKHCWRYDIQCWNDASRLEEVAVADHIERITANMLAFDNVSVASRFYHFTALGDRAICGDGTTEMFNLMQRARKWRCSMPGINGLIMLESLQEHQLTPGTRLPKAGRKEKISNLPMPAAA